MTEEEILELYRAVDAYREGHFRLSSGLHSNRYFQSALVLAHGRHASRLGEELARRLAPVQVDLVLGPALGAIIVAHEVGRALSRPAFFAERVDGRLTLRRGFVIAPGARVVVTEDVLTTGGSVAEVADLVVSRGAHVVGVACLIDRMPDRPPFDWPLTALARIPVQAWKPEECPSCRDGVPLEAPGSRTLAGPPRGSA